MNEGRLPDDLDHIRQAAQGSGAIFGVKWQAMRLQGTRECVCPSASAAKRELIVA